MTNFQFSITRPDAKSTCARRGKCFAYASELEAARACARFIGNNKKRLVPTPDEEMPRFVYQCPDCHMWHLTKNPNGNRSFEEILQERRKRHVKKIIQSNFLQKKYEKKWKMAKAPKPPSRLPSELKDAFLEALRKSFRLENEKCSVRLDAISTKRVIIARKLLREATFEAIKRENKVLLEVCNKALALLNFAKNLANSSPVRSCLTNPNAEIPRIKILRNQMDDGRMFMSFLEKSDNGNMRLPYRILAKVVSRECSESLIFAHIFVKSIVRILETFISLSAKHGIEQETTLT